MVSREVEPTTLTILLTHVRERLLEVLPQPTTPQNNAALTNLWRTCLTVHDLAEMRQDQPYVHLMEKMIDAIADYHDLAQPERVEWEAALPTVEDIRQAADRPGANLAA
jgi:hypothetical protein